MFFLLLWLTATPSFASVEFEESSKCAQAGLSAIYGAERSYHSEYEVYSSSLSDIGYVPEESQCKTWKASVRIFNGGQEFLATYAKATTGETWEINEKKELRQTAEGRAR